MSPSERQTAERNLANWRQTRAIFRGMLADERKVSPALFLDDAPHPDAPLYILTMWRCVTKVDVLERAIVGQLARGKGDDHVLSSCRHEGEGQ